MKQAAYFVDLSREQYAQRVSNLYKVTYIREVVKLLRCLRERLLVETIDRQVHLTTVKEVDNI